MIFNVFSIAAIIAGFLLLFLAPQVILLWFASRIRQCGLSAFRDALMEPDDEDE